MLADTGEDELRRVFQHIFLPPQLPQKADDQSDIPLVRVTITGLVALKSISPSLVAADNALVALKIFQDVNSLPDGAVSETALLHALKTLESGHSIPIHVCSQNAAIMVTRQANKLIFEEFELSPRNEAVMTTKGRLIRTFPGLAVAADTDKVRLADLVPAVANTVATMCQQPVPGMQPQSRKARSDHDELRDTTHPAAVSELFFGFLRGFGETVSVSAISRNTREEVLWKDAKAPWRRSPMWLLIRVVLQLTIERSPDGSYPLYKEIMVFVMSQVLQASLQYNFPSDTYYAMSAKIVRRLYKLHGTSTLNGDDLHHSINASIDGVLQRTSNVLSLRWEKIQQQNGRELDLGALARLDFEADTHVALPALEMYIEGMQSRQGETGPVSFLPSSYLIKYTPGTLPRLPSGNSVESRLCHCQPTAI